MIIFSLKGNNYLVIFLFLMMISNYLVVAGKYFFFEKDSISSAPINYEILDNSSKDFSLKEIESDSITLSNEMLGIFEKYNFTIESFIDNSYENLIVFSSLPDDFLLIEPARLKKNLFIKTILPIVFLENERVLAERKKILEWWTETDGEQINKEFWPEWLKKISQKYSFDGDNIGNLLMRIDIIPISLAISQAAIESGWGSSRYAREGNAIFGQYTYDNETGLIPKDRSDEKTFLIKKFLTLSDSVESYIKNLNTHNAYSDFRKRRKDLRMNGENISGDRLSEKLLNYSERRDLYILDIKEVIKINNFLKFDKIYKTQKLIN